MFPVPGDHLKHRCLELPKVEFWLGLSRGRILLLSFSVGEEAENDFNGPLDNLNNRFFDFIQISFCVGQEAQNVFAVPCNH